MSGLDRRRVVKVTSLVKTADGRKKYLHGTGYFITGDLLLTANHVLSEGTPTATSVYVEEGEPGWLEAELKPVWSDTELDAALLRVTRPLEGVTPTEFFEGFPENNVPWGSRGFPIASTQESKQGDEWKSAGLNGLVLAHGGGGQGRRVLELGVDYEPGQGDGWRGISGAPVFVDDKLAGIIKSHLPAFSARRLDAVPVAQLVRSSGFLIALTPRWLEPLPTRPWCLVLVSEGREEKRDEYKLQVSAALRRNVTDQLGGAIEEEPKVVVITEALRDRPSWLRFVRAVCAAPVMVIDVTDFEPAVMLMLGVRAVVRRGVTITTTSKRIAPVASEKAGADAPKKTDAIPLSSLPFNIQETKLISLVPSPRDKMHPVDKIGQAILDGLKQLKSYPGYLDLPAYDAVRCPMPKTTRAESAGEGDDVLDLLPPQPARDLSPVQDTVLLLCPFHEQYEVNRDYIVSQIITVASKDLVRILDIMSPRLVGQALYEHIRWSRCCIADWTLWRANVFFELGVRLACSGVGPVCLIEGGQADGDAQLLQQRQLITLLAPIRYHADGSLEPFQQAWQRYESFSDAGKATPTSYEVLEHDETYRAIALDAYDWRQELTSKLPHEEILAGIELHLGKDPQSAGKYPVLFSTHPELATELQLSAAERGIAAWYYFRHRRLPEDVRSADDDAKEEATKLGEKVLQWIPKRAEYKGVREGINSTLDLLLTPQLQGTESPLEKIGILVARVKRYRDGGKYEWAIRVLRGEAIPLAEKELATADATAKPELAVKLADCYGLLGGCYRRWALKTQDGQTGKRRLVESVKSYKRGQEVEAVKEYGIASTYNVLNSAVSLILLDPRYLTDPASADDYPEIASSDARADLQRVRGEMESQTQRDDVWFLADQVLVRLLLNENDPDPKEVYSLFLNPERTYPDYVYESMLSTLVPLAKLENLEPKLAAKLREVVERLKSRLAQLRQ